MLIRFFCTCLLVAVGVGPVHAQLTPNYCYNVDNTNAPGDGIIGPPDDIGISSPLNCTANDLGLTNVVFTPLDGCINEEDTATFTITGNASSTALTRFDVGFWINGNGGDAEIDPGTVGDECQVMYLHDDLPDGTPANVDPYLPGLNQCGDVPQSPDIVEITFDRLTVDCKPSDADACAGASRSNVSFNNLIMYGNNQNDICTGLADALTPGTTAKCFSGCSTSTTAIPALTLTKICEEDPGNHGDGANHDDKILFPGDKLNCILAVENAEFLDDGVSPAGPSERIYVYDFFPAIFGPATTAGGSVGGFIPTQGNVDGPDTTNAYDGNTFEKENSFLWNVGTLQPGSGASLLFVMTVDPDWTGSITSEFTCNSAKLALDNPGPAPIDESTTATTPGPDQKINLWLDNPSPDAVGSNDPVAGRGVIGELQAETVEVGGCRITRAAISDFYVSNAGGVNAIRWRTSSEEGTLGFHVERLDPASGEYVRLNSELLPANIAAPQGSEYEYVDGSATAGQGTYRIVEQETVGRTLVHGPFETGKSDSRSETQAPPASSMGLEEEADVTAEDGKYRARGNQRTRNMERRLEKMKQQHQPRGKQKGEPPVNKGKGRNSSSLVQPDEGFSVAGMVRYGIESVVDFLIPSAHAADAMKVETNAVHMHTLPAQQIADAFGVTATSVEQRIATGDIKITSHGTEIGWHQDSDGIVFFAEALSAEESLYAKNNVSWVTLEAGTVGGQVNGIARKSNSVSFRETLDVEEDMGPMIQFPQPDGDFWYWAQLTGSDLDGSDITFASPGATGAGDVVLSVKLMGAGIDADNRVDMAVNGTPVQTAQWQGKSEQIVTATFDGSLLEAGVENTLSLTPASDASFTFVLLDSLTLEYDREYAAESDFLRFRAEANSAVTVTGFSSKSISVFDVSNPATPVQLTGLKAKRDSGTYKVTLKTQPGAEYVAYANSAEDPVAVSSFDFQGVVASVQSADYISIGSERTLQGAQAIADYRQSKGHQTAVVTIEQIVDELNDGIPTPWAVRDFLKQAWTASGGKTKYALIAGAGNFDYRDLSTATAGTNLVPPPLAENIYGVFGADMLWGDIEGDDWIPEIAVGRIPAFTNEELQAYLDKLRTSEENHDGQAERALLIADDAESFGQFDYNSDRATADMPRSMEFIKAYLGKPYSAAEVTSLITTEINNGVSLAYYLGHGAADHLATEHIFDLVDVNTLSNADLPVFIGLTCSITRFDIPGYESLGMALVMKEGDGGVSAVWGPTSLSNNHWATGVGQEFLRAVFRQGKQTVGEAVVAAMREQGPDSDLLSSHMFSQILGDPASIINR